MKALRKCGPTRSERGAESGAFGGRIDVLAELVAAGIQLFFLDKASSQHPSSTAGDKDNLGDWPQTVSVCGQRPQHELLSANQGASGRWPDR